jgi:hypothetical protein
MKHDHTFTGVTNDTVNALDAKFPNKQWARSIRIAIVGGDGVKAAIVGGGSNNDGREERNGRIIIFKHCFFTVLALAGGIGGI